MAEQSEREKVIPLVDEQIDVSKREIERGRVVIRTHIEEREEIAEAALRQEEVIVERVPIGLPVETAAPVCEEDVVLIVPVLEEQLVVQSPLVLKEELRITKKSRTEVFRQPVRLRSDQADVAQSRGKNATEFDDPGDPSDDGTNPHRDVWLAERRRGRARRAGRHRRPK